MILRNLHIQRFTRVTKILSGQDSAFLSDKQGGLHNHHILAYNPLLRKKLTAEKQ